ncbi:MAG: heme ABC transporter ATP-binding protein [Pseudomonadota bacterium]
MWDASDIRVKLSGNEVLHGVNFAARPGQVTAIVGPNGSGKTTLLRALTQEVEYSGAIALGGKDVKRLKPWELADIRAVLPQSSRIAFPFTVLEVVRLGLLNGSAATHSNIPTLALSRVGLDGYEGRFFQELSGGEQQRVQLARVLAQVWVPVAEDAPRWLFLDEPVASLDIGHQIEVMGIARDFAGAGGGVVAVMHDLNLTAIYADHVTVLAGGMCLATGTPSQVLTDETLTHAYGCHLRVNTLPENGTTFVLPHSVRQAG